MRRAARAKYVAAPGPRKAKMARYGYPPRVAGPRVVLLEQGPCPSPGNHRE